MGSVPLLYSHFLSSCSWRVRIVLALKEIYHEVKVVDFLKRDNVSPEFLALNPMGQIPSLVIDGHVLNQSIAIMEYLEEMYPKNSIFPKDPVLKAKVREISELIGSGIQPLQNPTLSAKAHPDDEGKRNEWAAYWIRHGFEALEKILQNSAGKYCVGDAVTMGDCCLVPQMYNAYRFKVDTTPFPIISRINDNLTELSEFKVSHATAQVDCPEEFRIVVKTN